MTAVAAIDIGSNSVRLLVTDEHGNELCREMTITKLAEGVDRTGELSEAALTRTLTVLERYAGHIRRYSVGRVRVTATSAARDARNRDLLFTRIERAVGVVPELLSGGDEAALSFAGATADRNRAEGPFVTLDIGGGSTELALGLETATHAISLDVGCVRLSERFLATGDPPKREQLRAARNHVRSLLANVEAQVPARSAATWLGLAGTVTSLAALDAGLTHYDPTRTHNYRLTRARAEALHDELCALPVEARAARLLEPQRAGVILGGTLVLVEILSYFERAEIVVSERDILDGLAASLR